MMFFLTGNVSKPAREHTINRVIGRALLDLSMDKAWEVEVKESKPTRSTSQNSLLWAIYEQIIRMGGEVMAGWTKDDLHEFFLGNHFGTEERNIFGKTKEVPLRRSSRLKKQEFSDFVESIVRFMAEQGVYIEIPGDL